MNLKKEFSSNQVVLLIMSSVNYSVSMKGIMKELAGKNVCYVTSNRTYASLEELFSKSKVKTDDVVFIDTISKTFKKVPDQAENVYYVSSPGALTELSLVIGKFLKHGFDYLIVDSMTNFSIYQDKKICIKFMADLVNKVKKSDTKAVFYALGGEDEVVNHVSTLVDKVVKI